MGYRGPSLCEVHRVYANFHQNKRRSIFCQCIVFFFVNLITADVSHAYPIMSKILALFSEPFFRMLKGDALGI